MLIVEPASRRRRSRQRVALALAGGGPLGAFYQLGALHALAECTEGLELTELRAYVGVSSGSIIAACLANGISTDDMARTFFTDDPAVPFPLTPGVLMQPAVREYVRCLMSVPSQLSNTAMRLVRDPWSSWAELLSPLSSLIPTGIFDNRPFERYLRELLSHGGRTNDFRQLQSTLRIVATDLNSGEEARFGEPGLDTVPISEAIRASTALPGLYTPVKIRGRTYVDGALLRTVHASLVLDQGADLLFSINPLVTFDATRGSNLHRDLAEEGLSVVMGQTFRALIQSRMQIGMATYRKRYPYSDRMLLQPDRDDEAMFFANVFRYRERRRLADHAYQRTRRDLLMHEAQLAPMLKRHGITLRADRLRDRRRAFHTSVEDPHAPTQIVSRQLNDALDRLSGLIGA